MSATELVLGNPFEAAAGREAAAAEVRAAATRPLASLEELVRTGQQKEARRLAVAMALVEGAGDARVLDAKVVPERLFTELGLSRRALREITAAALRCDAAIRQIAGDSDGVKRVRAEIWEACFGQSVYEAIRMRPLIREHNVLVLGETGTGKELVAQAIAAADVAPERAQAVNAAAIPRDLLEAELFGHVKGAFTGATTDREGKIVAAAGSTLFLDEIADLPLELQAKLLRVVEDDRVTPLGANSPRKVDVRYVLATSRPLEEMVARGEFRRDLYERFAGVTIRLPPLRDRLDDLQPIADGLFQRYEARLGSEDPDSGAASTAHLSKLTAVQARFRAWLATAEARERPWNGNVRELQTLMRSWILGFKGSRPAPRSEPAPRPVVDGPAASAITRFLEAQAPLRELEDWYILHVLETVGYRHRRAAEILGIDRGTLARRLKQIDPTLT